MTKQPTLPRPEFIWVFDRNHRVYRQPKTFGGGGLIWKAHWVKRPVTGETSRSWLIGNQWDVTKVPKNYTATTDAHLRRFAFSEEEIEDLAWLQDRRGLLSQHIHSVNDPAILKQIAAITGFAPPSDKVDHDE